MEKNISYNKAREIMLGRVKSISCERVPLPQAFGRILAEDLTAESDVPPFDRSPFDGYAFKTEDTLAATRENPAILRIIEEVPAGSQPTMPVTSGTATKILTGSPVPDGADGIIKYEFTEFTDEYVKLFEPVLTHDIVRRGEDVKKGDKLSSKGERIDAALFATLAAQGVANPLVYKIPKIGIISTGNELIDVDGQLGGGKIRNTNKYMLDGAIRQAGAEPVHLGVAGDTAEEIKCLFEKGLEGCDMIFSTGGASVGDYDATPKAMELSGIEIIVRKLKMKPGGACAYGICGEKTVFCLSGNPAAAAVNFYAVGLACLRKLSGLRDYMLKETTVILADDFKKRSVQTRLIRGRLDISDGVAKIHFAGQGNAMLHAMIGCDVLAEIPAGTPKADAGTRLRAYIL